MKRAMFLFLDVAMLMLTGCSNNRLSINQDVKKYHQISQEEAVRMMEMEDGHVIVDVRHQDEYVEGHIPGAILIPNESITTKQPSELPDKDQIILIYCRSGNRSKQAAEKLCDMGYTNIYEFGGISTWKGEIISGDSDTFNPDEAEENEMDPTVILIMEVNGKQFFPTLESNSSVEAFLEKLNSESIKLELHDYGNFEKVGSLPWQLPTNDEKITTVPGDIILYQGNQIAIYYDENTWEFTRLAQIDDVTKDDLLELFGDGNVTVEFCLEWTE